MVVDWLDDLQLSRYGSEVEAKRINGRVLLCLVNNEALGQLGITTSMHITQIMWNIEAKINGGDEKAAKMIDTSLFNRVPQRATDQAERAAVVDDSDEAPNPTALCTPA